MGRPHYIFHFSKLSKMQSNVLDPDPGVKTGSGSEEMALNIRLSPYMTFSLVCKRVVIFLESV